MKKHLTPDPYLLKALTSKIHPEPHLPLRMVKDVLAEYAEQRNKQVEALK